MTTTVTDRLEADVINLAVDAQAVANRLRAQGGSYAKHGSTMLACATQLARTARAVANRSGGHPTLNLFFGHHSGIGEGEDEGNTPD